MKISINSYEKISWTKHVESKMRQYGLSKKRVLRILRRSERKEIGIVPDTICAMQSTGTKKHPTEVWMMYQEVKPKFKNQKSKITKIISAWRYPARSPVGEPPIPKDVLEGLSSLMN